jgi:hypothetical protein
MTQTLYAHMNKRKKKKRITEQATGGTFATPWYRTMEGVLSAKEQRKMDRASQWTSWEQTVAGTGEDGQWTDSGQDHSAGSMPGAALQEPTPTNIGSWGLGAGSNH